MYACMCLSYFHHVQLFAIPWTIAHQVPLSMELSRQEYWSGLPFPSPGGLPDPGRWTWVSCIEGGFFTGWATREAYIYIFQSICVCVCVCVCIYIYIYALLCHSVVSNSLQPHGLWSSRLLWPWGFSGKNPGVGYHALLQGIFPT